MRYLYVLKDKIPVVAETFEEWYEFINSEHRVIQQDNVDEIFVSTVFLGISVLFHSNNPMFFETMIFGREPDNYQERYNTYDEAVAGHQKALDMVKLSLSSKL